MVDMVDRKLIRMVVLVAFKAITMPHDGLHTHQEATMMAGMERPHGTVLMGHSVDCVPSLCRYVADMLHVYLYGVDLSNQNEYFEPNSIKLNR